MQVACCRLHVACRMAYAAIGRMLPRPSHLRSHTLSALLTDRGAVRSDRADVRELLRRRARPIRRDRRQDRLRLAGLREERAAAHSVALSAAELHWPASVCLFVALCRWQQPQGRALGVPLGYVAAGCAGDGVHRGCSVRPLVPRGVRPDVGRPGLPGTALTGLELGVLSYCALPECRGHHSYVRTGHAALVPTVRPSTA